MEDKITIKIRVIGQEDYVEAIKSRAPVYDNYVYLDADDSIRDMIDASRIYVERYYDDENDENVWLLYPHQLFDEEGLNDRSGRQIELVADVLRYMRQNNKTVVDKDVMQYIYSVQDRKVKEILRRLYGKELEELKNKLNEKLKEKEEIEKSIEELTNKIREIETKIS